jgi:hypothetical protein
MSAGRPSRRSALEASPRKQGRTAFFPGALGYAGWAYVSARASAAVAGSALYLVPAVSMLLSHLVLGEVPSAAALAGGALVLAGVAAVHRRAGAKVAPPRADAAKPPMAVAPVRVTGRLRADAQL